MDRGLRAALPASASPSAGAGKEGVA